MSAVMSTLSIISGGRRAHRKLTNSSRKSGQFSDAGDERTRSHNDLKQRSASLQTLEITPNGGVVNLESLEAKMASIEVSLASSRRRSSMAREQGRELDALRNALQDKDSLIQSLKTQLSASLSAARLAAQAASPLVMKGGRDDVTGPLSAEERRALEERAHTVRKDLELRKNNITDIRRRLERTHVTENIDSRIQQAELQYKLGREELELLTLSEQARVLQALIQHADNTDNVTLYNTVRDLPGEPALVWAEAREGAWGAAQRSGPGLYVDWAREHSTLRPGDRLVEVNGVPVLSCRSHEELERALRCAAAPARLVLLRARHTTPHPTLTHSEVLSLRTELGAVRAAAEDAAKEKQRLRADNTRLTHRISYLEEQVAELLPKHTKVHSTSGAESRIKSTVNKSRKNVTNISITSEPSDGCAKSEVQVFQKGPDITALVAKLPGLEAEAALPMARPRSNASGASARHPPSPPHTPLADYGAETDAALKLIQRNQRHIDKHRHRCDRLARTLSVEDRFKSDSELDRSVERSIEESIKKTNWAERKTLSIIEQLKKSQRLRKLKKCETAGDDSCLERDARHAYARIDGKVIENAHKSNRRFSRNTRSAISSEWESECSERPDGEEARTRPTPPRKPLRLSLHRARSAHSLAPNGETESVRTSSELECAKKPVKRSHWSRNTPRPPRRVLETPAADDLYPERSHSPMRDDLARWC